MRQRQPFGCVLVWRSIVLMCARFVAGPVLELLAIGMLCLE